MTPYNKLKSLTETDAQSYLKPEVIFEYLMNEFAMQMSDNESAELLN